MSAKNNIVSLEHSVVASVERAVIAVLENRCHHWVGQHLIFTVADSVALPNMNSMQVINGMVKLGTLERSYQTVVDKFGRGIQLPMYRLPPF